MRMWGVAVTGEVNKASCTVLHDCSAFKPLHDCMHHSHGIISQISDVHLGFTQDHNTVAPLNNSKRRRTPAQSAQHWGPEGKKEPTCNGSSMAEREDLFEASCSAPPACICCTCAFIWTVGQPQLITLLMVHAG